MSLQLHEDIVVTTWSLGFPMPYAPMVGIRNFLGMVSSWIQVVKGEDVLRLVWVPVWLFNSTKSSSFSFSNFSSTPFSFVLGFFELLGDLKLVSSPSLSESYLFCVALLTTLTSSSIRLHTARLLGLVSGSLDASIISLSPGFLCHGY